MNQHGHILAHLWAKIYRGMGGDVKRLLTAITGNPTTIAEKTSKKMLDKFGRNSAETNMTWKTIMGLFEYVGVRTVMIRLTVIDCLDHIHTAEAHVILSQTTNSSPEIDDTFTSSIKELCFYINKLDGQCRDRLLMLNENEDNYEKRIDDIRTILMSYGEHETLASFDEVYYKK